MIFDLETHLIAPGCTFPRIVVGAHETDHAGGPALLDRDRTVELVASRLARGVPLEGHWIAFDLGCIVAAEPTLAPAVFAHYRAGLVRCTQVRGWLIDAAEGCLGKLGPYSLSRLHERCIGTPLDKSDDTWRLRYSELDGVPIDAWPEAARLYPVEDVQATRRVFDFQDRFLDRLEDERRQASSAFALALTAGWGLVTDPRKVDAFEDRYRREMAELEDVLRGAGLVRPDGTRDMKATAARVRAAYGDAAPLTDKGGVCTDALTCTEAPNGDPVLVAYGRLGQVKSQITKNLPLLRQGICHTRYGFAASGRSTSDGPNVQNLDKKSGVRECFVPRPGFVYAIADFSTLELCTLAQVEIDLFGSSALGAALNSGEDPHTSLACSILGIPYAQGAALHDANDGPFEEVRGACKVANFGFPGGLGVEAFCSFALGNYGLRIEPTKAHELKSAWLRRWALGRYFDHVNQIVNTSGTLRHVRSNRWRGRVGYTDGCNTYFQGLGSDAARAAHFEVVAATFTPGTPLWGSHAVNFVHDDIAAEVPDDHRAAPAAEEISRIMVEQARVWIPDVKIKAAPLLARYLSKKAKPLRDASGGLIPWG